MCPDIESILEKASSGRVEVADSWMPASRIRPFVVNEPGQIWLEKFGEQYGFYPDPISPNDYLNFLFSLDNDFRRKWHDKFARNCPQVCEEPYHVRYKYRLEQTLRLMADEKTQIIYQPALWWAPDSIYGMPDFLVRTSWLKQRFEPAYKELEKALSAGAIPDQFVILGIRFSMSNIDPRKESYWLIKRHFRFHNYMLGQIQGWVPPCIFLVTQINPAMPGCIAVECNSNGPLDNELSGYVSRYQEIIRNGENVRPWLDAQVELNLHLDDDKWKTARKKIAWKSYEGGDPIILPHMRKSNKEKLAKAGFITIDDLLKVEPKMVPFENAGIVEYAPRIRAILQANRTNLPLLPTNPPKPKEFEFFVDFEYFSDLSLGTDGFNNQFGEMIFMIGVGINSPNGWVYQNFIAEKIGSDEELRIINEFTDYIRKTTQGLHLDNTKTSLYHWSKAEVSQSKKAIENHPQGLDMDFPLLPWTDLLDSFRNEGCAIPGVWDYGLKSVAKALGKLRDEYDPKWIGDLDDGSDVIVLGYKSYQKKVQVEKTDEMKILKQYLQADCRALNAVLKWMRCGDLGAKFDEAGLSYVGWEQVKKGYQESKPRTAYAELNNGKGVVVYLHPGLPDKHGEPTGIKPVNHLIWGDWLEILDEQGDWYKVHTRSTYGWMHKNWVREKRLLEINFVDVGQGDGCLVITPDDRKLLIDAGEADNMYRFLRWRFSNFKKQVKFDALIISHPDMDHYAGFSQFFTDSLDVKNIKFNSIYHNGIFEEKSKKITIQKEGKIEDISIVFQIIQTQLKLEDVLKNPSESPYLALLRAAKESNRVNEIRMINATSQDIIYLDGFEKGKEIEIEVLGPILETYEGTDYLRWFAGGGKTKNGHSVVLRLIMGNIRIMLGGDLNEKSEEFLLTHYANLAAVGGKPEKDKRIEPARKFLESEIAKSCHHGSVDISPGFLKAVNALASIISSGDDEPHCHPRPETIGILGKYGRGEWPTVFSTELARSTRDIIQHPYQLRRDLDSARKEKKESEFIDELIGKLDRSVAVYGMITLRTDGHHVLIAQKLERPRSAGQKWDTHLLSPDEQGQLVNQLASE